MPMIQFSTMYRLMLFFTYFTEICKVSICFFSSTILLYYFIFGFIKSQAGFFVSYMRSTTLLLFPAVCLHNCHAFSFISFMFNWVSSDLNFRLIQWSWTVLKFLPVVCMWWGVGGGGGAPGGRCISPPGYTKIWNTSVLAHFLRPKCLWRTEGENTFGAVGSCILWHLSPL